MTPFQQALDAAGIRPGETGKLFIARGAAFGHPELGRKFQGLSHAITVIRHKPQAARKTSLSTPTPVAAQGPRKPRGIRMATPRKLFGQGARTPAARGTWTAEGIASNVLQAR